MRGTDRDAFFPAAFAGDQLAGRFADAELAGDKTEQMLVGFTVDRRRLNPEFQPVAMQTNPLVFAGFGLNMEVQRQNPLLPKIPVQPIKLAS